jgi:hypothetical protein
MIRLSEQCNWIMKLALGMGSPQPRFRMPYCSYSKYKDAHTEKRGSQLYWRFHGILTAITHTKWNCTTARVIIADITLNAGRAHQKSFLIVRFGTAKDTVAVVVEIVDGLG